MYQLQIFCGGWRDAFHSQSMLFLCISDASRIIGRLWRVIQVTETRHTLDGHIMSSGRVVWGEGAIVV
jgi:hypothetical protein